MTGCVALIVAAGRGTRFGGELPKQYLRLGGETILRRSLRAFTGHPEVSAVRAVIHPDDLPLYEAAAEGLGALSPVPGGESRQESVRLGLESLVDDAPDRVLIHDGARPFVDAATISRVIAALEDSPGAIPALPVVDTLKRSDGNTVGETVDRAGLWRAQTPQGFRFDAILAAHKQLIERELTDDAALAEHCGLDVTLVAGDENNLKVTSRQDLERAERLMIATETRTGTGFDVHAFAPGEFVTLCGVEITHDSRLAGHSDADVAMHALTDALLGAIAAGDIGDHFPPSDAQWRGAASETFLAHAVEQIRLRGGAILGVDVTIICEAPKIAPHRDAMRANIARILGVDTARVSIKGTTTEKLGFTGRGEGIAAQAAATVRLPAGN